MTIHRTKTLTIVGMMILQVPVQTHTAWRLPSFNFVAQLSRKSIMCSGLVTSVLGCGIYYWWNKKTVWQDLADNCKVRVAQAKQQALHDILKNYNDAVSSTHQYTITQVPHTTSSNFTSGNRSVFEIFEHQNYIGSISYTTPDCSAPFESIPHINYLGITRSHQGKGLGTLLMRYAMRMIANKGYKKITLRAVASSIDKQEDLRKFYQRLGFENIRGIGYDPDKNNPNDFVFNNRIVGISSDALKEKS
jgi:ribosomal protein S18 acetylase RimI-like enzyme